MKDQVEIINESFQHIGISSKLDSRNRVTLGQVLMKLKRSNVRNIDEFEILLGTEGDILLRPRTSIPTRELWLYQNPNSMRTLQKGLKDAAEGRIIKVTDLNEFTDRL
ncbi:MAG: hypothetical protein L3J12_10280 [Spirochaetales bacterium]|nr:hypothetical protein [Spirochaetales bacterium]